MVKLLNTSDKDVLKEGKKRFMFCTEEHIGMTPEYAKQKIIQQLC